MAITEDRHCQEHLSVTVNQLSEVLLNSCAFLPQMKTSCVPSVSRSVVSCERTFCSMRFFSAEKSLGPRQIPLVSGVERPGALERTCLVLNFFEKKGTANGMRNHKAMQHQYYAVFSNNPCMFNLPAEVRMRRE